MKIKRAVDIPDRDELQWAKVKLEDFWIYGEGRRVVFKGVADRYKNKIYNITITIVGTFRYYLQFVYGLRVPLKFFKADILYNEKNDIYLLTVEKDSKIDEYLMNSRVQPVGKL